MKTLVIGANGATGIHLVNQLINMNQEVKVIIRMTSEYPKSWNNNLHVKIIKANIYELHVNQMAEYIKDCNAIASCLGHNLSWKGIYGKPQKLVTNAVKLLSDAIVWNSPNRPVKFVLMNTSGNNNHDIPETNNVGEKIVLGLIRLLLPPHSDNEQAAEQLRLRIGQNHHLINWVVVRPDTLTNEKNVTPYTLHPSPTSSPIFAAQKTSRINVGNFMAKLMTEDDLWNKWKGQMPVIYNSEQ
ncbi:NAD(P)H-binding protein [Reichenbachiella versicolor]|uniref:NAD(P)H-binding protein n=1 Tax=Reichenbachiella versicolor TaxID=1821036 RepID=UPI000D6E2B39|nr:NAD(P)H-binding protein [Reichenbachiella versicolor]